MKGKKLDKDYYLNPDVNEIAKDLIGKVLCTNFNGVYTSGVITETEAYAGAEDKASHAFGNKRTKRTETMFSEGGIAYVYLIYGIHHLFNVVSNVEGVPHAILVRGIKPLDGKEIMIERRGWAVKNLSNGPGTLSQALGIKTSHDKEDLNSSTIWIEDRGIKILKVNLKSRPRVGVGYAKEDALLKWNYFIDSEVV